MIIDYQTEIRQKKIPPALLHRRDWKIFLVYEVCVYGFLVSRVIYA